MNLISMIVLILPLVARAQITGDPEVLRKIAPQIVAEVAASGVEKMGDYPLIDMQKRLESVKYVLQEERYDQLEPVTLNPSAAHEKYRLDGRYLDSKQTVFLTINPRYTQVSSEPHFDLLLLHESLGASGYPDFNYGISSAIYLLWNERRAPAGILKELSPAFSPLRSLHFEKYLQGGSGTAIGHGGDFDGVLLKYDLLRQAAEISFELSREIVGGTDIMIDSSEDECRVNDLGEIGCGREFLNRLSGRQRTGQLIQLLQKLESVLK